LFLQGIVFDTALIVADEISPDSFPGFPKADNVRILKEFFQKLEGQILESPLVKKRYVNTAEAIAAWVHSLFHPEDEGQMKTEHFCYRVLMGHHLVSGVDDDLAHKIEYEVKAFSIYKIFTLVNKRPFISSTGYIGVTQGAGQLEPGDLICLFRGGPVPFILRKRGETYRFVGGCYIHGVMEIEEQKRFLEAYDSMEFPLE
jgi:hypothetical protein